MNNANEPDSRCDAFDRIGQEGRIARMSRMINPDEQLTDGQRQDIITRVVGYAKKHDIALSTIAKQIHISKTTVSEVLLGRYGAKADKHIKALNNWMELSAKRRDIIQSREYVETAVAKEIIFVAEIVSETCMIGVVYGPAHIGKTFTLKALEKSDRLGNPVLIKIDQSHRSPIALCRLVCDKFDLSANGTFDVMMRRLVKRLDGTMRMIMFDEVDRVKYETLEFIRDVHDHTGCPILLSGKPAIFDKLSFREMGGFLERLDQLTSRVVIRRDLTQRTRSRDQGGKGEPLFTRDDIRNLIKNSNLELKVTPGAEQWLQDRASTLGCGGIGQIASYLYLAYKYASAGGASEIAVKHLEAIQKTTMEHESAKDETQQRSQPQHTRFRRLA